jgi:hypothetical protein
MWIGRARGIEDCRFLTAREVGHGAGLGGTHRYRIWHGRYRRPCCWGFLGRLCLCLSRGSSGRGGREATRTPAGGEGGTAQAAWRDEGLVRPYSRRNDGSPNRIRRRFSLPHDLVLALWRFEKMRSLVVLVATIVAIAASALPAGSHEWYTGLRSPSGAPSAWASWAASARFDGMVDGRARACQWRLPPPPRGCPALADRLSGERTS